VYHLFSALTDRATGGSIPVPGEAHPGSFVGLENEVSDALASGSDRKETDERFLCLALDEAREARAEDEVPIGAVIAGPAFRTGLDPAASPSIVLARAHNRTRAECDPTAHAELLAIRAAAYARGYLRLDGCTLYTTVEPCFMCAGAIVHARFARVVWGVRDPKFGAVVSLGEVFDHPGSNHRVRWTEGVGAEESRALLQEFFRSKRKREP